MADGLGHSRRQQAVTNGTRTNHDIRIAGRLMEQRFVIHHTRRTVGHAIKRLVVDGRTTKRQYSHLCHS